MRLTLIFVVVLACFSAVFASDGKDKDLKALQKACKELGGGAKIRFEIDLSGACPGCKRRKKKAPPAPVEAIPAGDGAGMP